MFSCEFCEVFKSTVLENCERPILSCYFNNLKIFCFHVLELYQYFLSCKKYLTSINEDCSQEMSHKKNVPIESLITASSFYILIDLKLIFSIFIHLQQIFPPSGIFPRSGMHWGTLKFANTNDSLKKLSSLSYALCSTVAN